MRNDTVFVTKSYLPNIENYKRYIDEIYRSAWLTNNGELTKRLEKRLSEYLCVDHLVLVANGSLAMQVAYKALELSGEVITTPFSFAATTSTLAWEGLTPVFADIDFKTFNIDPLEIKNKITKKTSAIVPVHVFGNPCDINEISEIAQKNGLKVIYDAAHAFDVKLDGNSILNYGDISTISFHATKLFHTIEGGAIIAKDKEVADKIRKMINFGISGPTTISSVGINAKMNEFEAAMGLCVLDEIELIKNERSVIWGAYYKALSNHLAMQKWEPSSDNNCAYAPVVFNDEKELLYIESLLKDNGIIARRYFYPSLDTADADSECNTLIGWLMGFHGTWPSARSSLLSDI